MTCPHLTCSALQRPHCAAKGRGQGQVTLLLAPFPSPDPSTPCVLGPQRPHRAAKGRGPVWARRTECRLG
eukprot:362944-Chlamydomonas_euryale.AAC.2